MLMHSMNNNDCSTSMLSTDGINYVKKKQADKKITSFSIHFHDYYHDLTSFWDSQHEATFSTEPQKCIFVYKREIR